MKEYQCLQENIILTTLFATPEGLQRICESYADMKIVVSEVSEVAPVHFAQKYFGKHFSSRDSLSIHLFFQELINHSSK